MCNLVVSLNKYKHKQTALVCKPHTNERLVELHVDEFCGGYGPSASIATPTRYDGLRILDEFGVAESWCGRISEFARYFQALRSQILAR